MEFTTRNYEDPRRLLPSHRGNRNSPQIIPATTPTRNNNIAPPTYPLTPPQFNSSNDSDPDGVLLSSRHYTEWTRLLRKSSRLRESLFKFLVNFLVYSGETASLVFTLITGVILPDSEHESYAAILLHVLACLVTIAVVRSNSKRSSGIGESVKELILNVSFLTKPFRYVTLFRLGRSRLRVIEEETRNGRVITEKGLKSLARLNKEELEDKRVEMHEVSFQNLPMVLLQTYFLFQSYQHVQLCNIKDLTRLSAILLGVTQAAKAFSAYDSSKHDLEQTLHFLAYYRSGGAHPMVIYSTDMFSMTGLFNFLSHFITILTRMYTATYFFGISFWLALLYLSSVFLVNLSLVKLYPQHLLEVYQNPPYGVSTLPSYYSDRWINVFSNIGTRFGKFSDTVVCKCLRLPLVFIQILHFAVPLAVVYSTKFMFQVEFTPSDPESALQPTTLNTTLSSCPEVETLYNLNPVTKKLGSWLFSSYRVVNDSFGTYNDIFGFFHVMWVLFYAQVAFTVILAYSDLVMRRKKREENGNQRSEYFTLTYPIVTAYSCYSALFTRVIRFNDADVARKLIVLTVAKEPEFYGLFRKCSRVCCCCWSRTVTDEQVNKLAMVIANRLPCPDEHVEAKINECVRTSHRFLTEFLAIRDILYRDSNSLENKRLFLGFFAYFDAKMYDLTSDRVNRIFYACCGGECRLRDLIKMGYYEDNEVEGGVI